MTLRQGSLLLAIIAFSSLFAAPGLPHVLRRPDIASRVFTHEQHRPMAEAVATSEADSLEVAVWPLGRAVPSVRRLFHRKDDHRFVTWGNERARVAASLSAGLAAEGDDEQQVTFVWQGVELDAVYGDRLSMWARWWSGHYEGDIAWADDYSPLVRGWLKHENGAIYNDELEGWICADTDFGKFALGRGAVQQGAGVSGSVILSADAGPYGLAAWELDAGPLRLSMMHGTLLSADRDTLYDYMRFEEKYLMLHRVDVQAHPRLKLFVGETIVYGGRAPDANYLLPHAFLRIVEHKLHDRDNVAIFAGYEWRAFDWMTLYGQGYLDELRKAELFGDWWGNKYAVQGGAVFETGRLPGGTPRFTLEGVAIRPWLYTHYTPTGDYTHDGMPLGYPLGANLVAGSVEANLPLLPSLDLDAQASFVRQGDVGAEPTTNYNTRPSDTAQWLESDTTDTLYVKSVVAWRPLAHHTLRVSCRLAHTDEDTHCDWLAAWSVHY